MLYDIPVLSQLNPPIMACSSSAVNDSVILTKDGQDDVHGASLAGLNPSSLKNEELQFLVARCGVMGILLKDLKQHLCL